MKSKSDPRHVHRKKVIKQLFAISFGKQLRPPSDHTQEILQNLDSIDGYIKKAAPAWPIEKINKVDLAVLRLAISELTKNKIPYKVIIDEAVELAKEYGSETSSSFVNGVLGTVVKELKLDKASTEETENA